MVVDVAIHSAQRLKGPQPIDDVHGAKIARMPYFIAIFEIFKHALVQKGMGV
jgi:hypothetical protein